jgi:hypothetical protein
VKEFTNFGKLPGERINKKERDTEIMKSSKNPRYNVAMAMLLWCNRTVSVFVLMVRTTTANVDPDRARAKINKNIGNSNLFVMSLIL